MNYETLLERARKEARVDADNLHPAGEQRDAFYRWLVVRKYLDYISPIVVEEAQSPP